MAQSRIKPRELWWVLASIIREPDLPEPMGPPVAARPEAENLARRPYRAYILGLEDGLVVGWGLGWINGSRRWKRAYEAGVRRGQQWRQQLRGRGS